MSSLSLQRSKSCRVCLALPLLERLITGRGSRQMNGRALMRHTSWIFQKYPHPIAGLKDRNFGHEAKWQNRCRSWQLAYDSMNSMNACCVCTVKPRGFRYWELQLNRELYFDSWIQDVAYLGCEACEELPKRVQALALKVYVGLCVPEPCTAIEIRQQLAARDLAEFRFCSAKRRLKQGLSKLCGCGRASFELSGDSKTL